MKKEEYNRKKNQNEESNRKERKNDKMGIR